MRKSKQKPQGLKRPEIDECRFSDLADKWIKNQHVDVELRHSIGSWLNEPQMLGSPEYRQPYAGEVTKLVADRLGTKKCVISRMRSFAHHHPDLDVFREEHPECITWTAVRELLPKESKKRNSQEPPSGSSKKSSASTSRVKFGDVRKSVKSVRETLQKLDRFKGQGAVGLRQELVELRQQIESTLAELEANSKGPKAAGDIS